MRQRIITMACSLVFALSLTAESGVAQPAPKSYRIGWLSNSSGEAANDPAVADFRQGLADLGYVEGKNVTIDYRYGGGSAEKLNEQATDLARQPVAVIVTSGDPAALAAKRATRTTQIVAVELALDPVKLGLVSSLARPDGNVTGLVTMSEELWQKRLALLKDIAPGVSRPAVIAHPANPSNVSCIQEIRLAAPTLGMTPRIVEVANGKALELALADLAKSPPDAIVICWDGITLANAKAIADLALRLRLPSLAPFSEYTRAGALLSFGTSLPAQRRRAAYYVDRMAKGVKASDIPVEQPKVFELVVNIKTAKALGLTVPPQFLLLADELIQ